jgi:hypothetical protein
MLSRARDERYRKINTNPITNDTDDRDEDEWKKKYLTKNNFNQSKYYEKYLKYKLKYNQLKEKFN